MSDAKNQAQQIQLPPNDLQLYEQVSVRFDAVIGQGVKPEDLLAPAFWAHHAVKLRPWNEIRARAEDGTWLANFVVLDCSRTWAKVQMLDLHRFTTADQSLTQAAESEVQKFKDQHKVTFRGAHKWSVVRSDDRAVLKDGVEQKDDAEKWLDTHARAQVGAVSAVPKPAAVAA